MKITSASYRSDVLSYVCTLAKVEKKQIKDLPPPLLSRLGVEIRNENGWTSTQVKVPENLESESVKKEVEGIRSFLQQHKHANPPSGGKRPSNGKKEFVSYHNERTGHSGSRVNSTEDIYSMTLPKNPLLRG